MNRMNGIQGQWTWTITGQYLRALAGMRFPRVGASECDVMFNLVPELATADSQVFWSNGCFTNMLDYGAEHLKLRQLDMPRNFFSGNNCVAEYGQFPSNFLLGVSTPASDIQFRRQMRSRLGEPITVAGNPPVKFASASFEAENRSPQSAGLPPLPDPGLPVRLLQHRRTAHRRGALLHDSVRLLVAMGRTRDRQRGHCLAAHRSRSGPALPSRLKKLLVGSNGEPITRRRSGPGSTSPTSSRRTVSSSGAGGRSGSAAGTVLSNPILRWMGCRIGQRTIVTQPMQCFDWNAVSFGNDCVVDGFLQFHTFENMMLKVKRTHIQDGCTVAFGATVMGGAVIERDTTLLPLSLVLKEMNMLTATYEGSPAEPVSGSTLSRSSRCDEMADILSCPERRSATRRIGSRWRPGEHGLRMP